MSVLIGRALRPRVGEIVLSNDRVAADAQPGDVVGRLSVEGGWPPYAWLLLADAGGRFALFGDEIRVAGAIDGDVFPITVLAVRQGAAGVSITATLTIVAPVSSAAGEPVGLLLALTESF